MYSFLKAPAVPKSRMFSRRNSIKNREAEPKSEFSALRTFVRYTAAILLVMLISGSAWLMLDVKARAEFFGWIKWLYNSSYFAYKYETAEPPSEPTVRYELPSIPDGYTLFLKKKTTAWLQRYTKTARDGF